MTIMMPDDDAYYDWYYASDYMVGAGYIDGGAMQVGDMMALCNMP